MSTNLTSQIRAILSLPANTKTQEPGEPAKRALSLLEGKNLSEKTICALAAQRLAGQKVEEGLACAEKGVLGKFQLTLDEVSPVETISPEEYFQTELGIKKRVFKQALSENPQSIRDAIAAEDPLLSELMVYSVESLLKLDENPKFKAVFDFLFTEEVLKEINDAKLASVASGKLRNFLELHGAKDLFQIKADCFGFTMNKEAVISLREQVKAMGLPVSLASEWKPGKLWASLSNLQTDGSKDSKGMLICKEIFKPQDELDEPTIIFRVLLAIPATLADILV